MNFRRIYFSAAALVMSVAFSSCTSLPCNQSYYEKAFVQARTQLKQDGFSLIIDRADLGYIEAAKGDGRAKMTFVYLGEKGDDVVCYIKTDNDQLYSKLKTEIEKTPRDKNSTEKELYAIRVNRLQGKNNHILTDIKCKESIDKGVK